MADLDETRRRFMAHFAGIGSARRSRRASSGRACRTRARSAITLAMVTDALKLSGIELTEAERKAMVESAQPEPRRGTRRCARFDIPNDVSPPFHFSAIVPGIEVNKTRQPFRLSAAPAVKRPANLEDVAFWPVRHLAELIRTQAGHVARADRDVSRAAAPLQRAS